MSTGAPDPLIHDPARLRIAATLAALPDGGALSVTRLQDMTGLRPGSLITGLRPGRMITHPPPACALMPR